MIFSVSDSLRNAINLLGVNNVAAEKLGVSRQQVSDWYWGRKKIPIHHAVMLSKLSGIRVEKIKPEYFSMLGGIK
jgi:DNA-binding transcriptional regulator YdaS (Cro superfamily)